MKIGWLVRTVLCLSLAGMLSFGSVDLGHALDADTQISNSSVSPGDATVSESSSEIRDTADEELNNPLGASEFLEKGTECSDVEDLADKAEAVEEITSGSDVVLEVSEDDSPVFLNSAERVVEDGVYGISLHMKPKFVLGVDSLAKGNGASVQLQKATGNAVQLFSLEWQEKDGAYRINSISTGKSVAASGTSALNGASLVQWDDNGTKNMRWKIISLPNGGVIFESVDTKRVMDFAANQPSSGVRSVVWEQTGNMKQVFDLVDASQLPELSKGIVGPKTVEDGIYSIGCLTSQNQVIEILRSQIQNGAAASLGNKGASSSQKFYVSFHEVESGLGYYSIRSLNSGKVLAVSGSDASSGTPVVQWSDNKTSNMRWVIERASSGGFILMSSDTGLNLDCACDRPVPGADIVVWENTGSVKQNFIFKPEKVLENGYYEISPNFDNQMAVVINGASGTAGANAVLGGRGLPDFSSKYEFSESLDGSYVIKSLLTGMVLCVSNEGKIIQDIDSGQRSKDWSILPDVYGGLTISSINESGDGVSLWTGGTNSPGDSLWAQDVGEVNSNQSFSLYEADLVTDGNFAINVATDKGYALSMSRLMFNSGNGFCLAYVRNDAMQQFQIKNEGNNVIQIVSPLTNKVLCVPYGSSRGASVIQWENNATDNMKWRVLPTFQGSVYLQNAASGMNLDFASNFPAQMSKLVVWDSHGGTKQRFSFTSAVYNPPRNRAIETGSGSYYWFDGSGRVNGAEAVSKILNTARSLLGVPYVWLGVYPQDGGMDCASFTWYLYRQLGIEIGFETYDQMYSGLRVNSLEHAKPGDLILMYYGGWPNYNPYLSEHVVLYAGGGMVYEEPTFGGRCQYVPLASKGATKIDIRRIIQN